MHSHPGVRYGDHDMASSTVIVYLNEATKVAVDAHIHPPRVCDLRNALRDSLFCAAELRMMAWALAESSGNLRRALARKDTELAELKEKIRVLEKTILEDQQG